jgi:DNA-binding response OmpR family regulator
MPGLSGCELADSLREERPGLQVLFVSGDSAKGDLQPADLPTGASLLQKPFRMTALVSRVRDMLGRPGGPALG